MKTIEEVNALTYGELKKAAKEAGLSVAGKSLGDLRTEFFNALNSGTTEPAKTAPEPAKATTPAAPVTMAPVPTGKTPEELAAEKEALASAMEAKKAEMEKLKAELNEQLEAAKKQQKEIAEAIRLQTKEAKKAEKALANAEKNAEKIALKEAAKAEKEAKKAEAKAAKELEMAVAYEKGIRVTVQKAGKTVTADVIATDIKDRRSGFTFVRFRRVLLEPSDNSEVAGGYFFKRNYLVPQDGGDGKEPVAPKA